MTRTRSRVEPTVSETERLKAVKRERLSNNRVDSDENAESTRQAPADRRALRSKYLAVKTQINDEKDDLSKVDSDKFRTIFHNIENLHELVQKPREQVADAEALLDIANALASSVKSQSNDGLSPSDFVAALLRDYGHQGGAIMENAQDGINWRDIGLAVSPIFRKCQGCCTVIGPMNTEIKQQKVVVSRKRAKPTESARPEELNSTEEERTDTDKHMATMFEILKKKKRVRLESLVLNRKSFAQTVENMFVLSFLVKDGRVEIAVEENGSHFVSPRNAPGANLVSSGEVIYRHFVFRYDFKDWKLMMDVVPIGEELMPHRDTSNVFAKSQSGSVPSDSQAAYPTTPIRKLSRNRGLVVQEESVVEDTPETEDTDAVRTRAIRMCKRKLNSEL